MTEQQSALEAEFQQKTDIASRCFGAAFDLLKQGKRAEAKKVEREGDQALKRARQLFKEIKASK